MLTSTFSASVHGDPSEVIDLEDKLASRSAAGVVFHSIANFVWMRSLLAMAWRIVSRSRGRKSAGIDGVLVADIFRAGVGQFVCEIARLLKTRSYKFSPLRGVVVPKDGGGERKLNIATVRDRVVLVALRLVLGPIFEVRMSAASFGYRPGRSVKDAIYYAAMYLGEMMSLGAGHIISADISNAFGSLDQKQLLQTIAKVVPDRRLLGILDASLSSGVLVHEHMFEATSKGVPQGTPLAGLLFNIGMMPIDRWLDSLAAHGVGWVRYADDILVFVPGPLVATKLLFSEFKARCEKLGLRVSEEKTRIEDITRGFSFLGTDVSAAKSADGIKYKLDPSEKTLRRFYTRVRAAREAQDHHRFLDVVLSLATRFPNSLSAQQAIELAREEVQLAGTGGRRALGGTTSPIPRPNGHALHLSGRNKSRSGSPVPPLRAPPPSLETSR